MSKKFTNLNPVPLFKKYNDPFFDRTQIGPVRPSEPLCSVSPDFKRTYQVDLLYFAWLGHSSVFLCMHGKTILIDPVFCKYTSPIPFLGPKRFPGKTVVPADFPTIDLVLITHNHYDHLDRNTIRSFDNQVKHYIVPSGVGNILQHFGVSNDKITELGWNQERNINGLTIACTPSQHGSARSPFDSNRSLWCSYVLKDEWHTVFDTGDGGFGHHFTDIHQRYGDMDLAIMECGQYNRRWHGLHMFPEESVLAAQVLHAKCAIPVHWGAYVLSSHSWEEPPARFTQRADELGVPCHLPTLNELLVVDTLPEKEFGNQ